MELIPLGAQLGRIIVLPVIALEQGTGQKADSDPILLIALSATDAVEWDELRRKVSLINLRLVNFILKFRHRIYRGSVLLHISRNPLCNFKASSFHLPLLPAEALDGNSLAAFFNIISNYLLQRNLEETLNINCIISILFATRHVHLYTLLLLFLAFLPRS